MGRSVGFDIEQVFCASEAEGRFLTTRDAALKRFLEREIKSGHVTCPLPHLYARKSRYRSLSPEEKHLHALRGLSQLHPSWTFALGSAALALGLYVDRSLINRVHVASRYHRLLCGVQHHSLRVDGAATGNGVPTTDTLQTMFDCLRSGTLVQTLGIADSGLAKLGIGRDEAAHLFREKWRRKDGFAHALTTLSFAEPRSESGGESYVRARIIHLGYTAPEVQVPFSDPMQAGKTYRVDLIWRLRDGSTVGCEVDGFQKYENPGSMGGRSLPKVVVGERQRESRLTIPLDRMMRITPKQAQSDWYLDALLRQYGIPRAESTGHQIGQTPCG